MRAEQLPTGSIMVYPDDAPDIDASTLSKPQLAWIRSEADRLGLDPAEVLRRLVDRARGE